MLLRRVNTPVKQIKPFARGRIVGLREAGWTYRRIAAHVGQNVLVVYRRFQQWSVEYSHTRRPGSGRPRNTDSYQDQRIVRAAVAAQTVYRDEIRMHVAPVVSPRAIGNRLLTVGLRIRVPLARLPLTPRHRQARLLCCRERVDSRMRCCL